MQGTITIDDVCSTLARLRAARPVVHCITNDCAKSFTASMLLAIGASAHVVEHLDEAEDFAGMAEALLINTGSLTETQIAAIRQAVPAARAAGKPWVLDPRGAGVLPVRTALSRHLLDQGPSVVCLSEEELNALARKTDDASGDALPGAGGARRLAAAALATRIVGAVVLSGPHPLATDGAQVVSLAPCHPLLARVTGSTCGAGALMAACAAVSDTPLMAAVSAWTLVSAASRFAGEKADRPGSFQAALLDAFDRLDDASLQDESTNVRTGMVEFSRDYTAVGTLPSRVAD